MGKEKSVLIYLCIVVVVCLFILFIFLCVLLRLPVVTSERLWSLLKILTKRKKKDLKKIIIKKYILMSCGGCGQPLKYVKVDKTC